MYYVDGTSVTESQAFWYATVYANMHGMTWWLVQDALFSGYALYDGEQWLSYKPVPYGWSIVD